MNRHAFRHSRRFAVLVAVLLLVPVPAVEAQVPGGSGFRTVNLPASAARGPIVGRASKEGRSRKLDGRLMAVAEAAQTSGAVGAAVAREAGLRVAGDRVQVLITAEPNSVRAVGRALAAAGGEVTSTSDGNRYLQGFMPVRALAPFSERADVGHVASAPQFFEAAGIYMTEGDAILNGAEWRTGGFDGTDVKVGIIDVGFAGYSGVLGTDLPSAVTVKNFVDGETDSQVNGTTEHGTACAEVIHDVAPGAQLFLAKVGALLDIEEAADWLQAQGVRIISSSIGIYNVTPGDGTGYFENIIAAKRAAGITWFTAASNDREAHWGGLWHDPDSDGTLDFAASQDVNYFGPGDGSAYLIPAGYLFSVFARWNDWTAPVDQDYDLYLLRWSGIAWDLIGGSVAYQDGGVGQLPTEEAFALTSGSTAPYGFVVTRYSAAGNSNFEIFAPEVTRLDEVVHARSLSNLADANSAVTVAALDVAYPYAQEKYSSQGPTNGPGGSLSGGNVKPDISGFANVSTAAYAPYLPYKFNGTSAATPHVAGAAALYLDSSPTAAPGEIEGFLASRAIDQGAVGLDTLFGHGRLYLGTPPAEALPTDLALVSTVDTPDPVVVGNQLTYTTTARNDGSQPADNVAIRQTVPPWTTFLGASTGCALSGASSYGGRGRGGLVTCSVGTLGVGATAEVTVRVGPLQDGSHTSTATVSYPGVDTLPTNDSLSALTTANYANGQTSRCTLIGGAGNDTVSGNSNVNVVCGFTGNDVLRGRGANDVLNGGPGVDRSEYDVAAAGVIVNLGTRLTSCNPSTSTTCGQGTDRLISIEAAGGSAYADRLLGNGAANRFWGRGGNDYQSGLAGNDRQYGEAGNDTLLGGDGNDYLNGGGGTDSCSGGAGTNTILNCP